MGVELQDRKTVSELFRVYVLSFVIAIFSMLTYIIGLIKHGPTKWLHVKKRNERPEILDSDQYGTHHWMPLKVNRVKPDVWDWLTIGVSNLLIQHGPHL